jgi:hypothetical protein
LEAHGGDWMPGMGATTNSVKNKKRGWWKSERLK